MRNPFHDELTPSAGLEKRIEAALGAPGADRDLSVRSELQSLSATRTRRSRRAAIAAVVVVMPVLAVCILTVVLQAGLPLGLLGGGSSQVPQGTGHAAPLFDSTALAAAPTAPPVATKVALVPTPTITNMDGCGGDRVNAAGTPIAETQGCVTGEQQGENHSQR